MRHRSYKVSATYDGRRTWVWAHERRHDIEIKFHSIYHEPGLTAVEAREFARALYVLAARLEKRLVQEQNASDAQAPAVPESGDEAREESEAPTHADLGADRLPLREASRVS